MVDFSGDGDNFNCFGYLLLRLLSLWEIVIYDLFRRLRILALLLIEPTPSLFISFQFSNLPLQITLFRQLNINRIPSLPSLPFRHILHIRILNFLNLQKIKIILIERFPSLSISFFCFLMFVIIMLRFLLLWR